MDSKDDNHANWKCVGLEIPQWPGLAILVFDSGEGRFKPCLLSQQNGALSYAAALRDHSGKIYSWCELWVQDPFAGIDPNDSGTLGVNNALVDQAWQRYASRLENQEANGLINMGYDTPGCAAIWLSADGTKIIADAYQWTLCVDESLLKKFYLAAYASTMHRYLWNGDSEKPAFIACTEGAPRGANVSEIDQQWKGAQPVNSYGSMMFLKPSNTLTLCAFSALLSGNSEAQSIRNILRYPETRFAELLAKTAVANKIPGLLHAKRNSPGQLAEIFHLKLCLIKGIFTAVSESVAKNQCPHFLLTPDSFHVSLSLPESTLPFMWSHHVSLVDLPHAVRKEIGDVREPIVVPSKNCVSSIYRSPAIDGFLQGTATVRIRKVSEIDDEGLVTIEGTMVTDQAIRSGKSDLFTLEWALPRSGRKQIVCRMETPNANPAAEYRFVSLPTKHSDEVAAILASLKQSISSAKIDFLFIPSLGSTCDLYSLAIICLSILVDHPEGLSIMLDDFMSLLHRSSKRDDVKRDTSRQWQTSAISLEQYIRSGESAELINRLGPHRIVANPEMSASEAFREIPSALWWATVSFLLRLLPNESADAFARNYDDFNKRAMHEVFRRPLEELELLVEKSRNVIFGNHVANREIFSVIRHVRKIV